MSEKEQAEKFLWSKDQIVIISRREGDDDEPLEDADK